MILWVVFAASLLGLLAVRPLLADTHLQPWVQPASEWLSFWQVISLVSLLALSITVVTLIIHRRRHHLSSHPSVIGLLSYVAIFLMTLVASSSWGIYQQLRYQQGLLALPLTTEATVSVTQISDTISDSAGYGHQSIAMGTGYSRQVWQITKLNTSSDKITLPLNVLVTANLEKHPEWQKPLTQLAPGSTLRVKLALQPIHQPKPASLDSNLPNNAKTMSLGFDESLWLQTKQVQAKAQLIELDEKSITTSGENWTVEKLRWQLRQTLLHQLKQSLTHSVKSHDLISDNQAIDSYAILLGLLTGDKALMGHEIKQRYQVTGISHLLAISGPHVLMLASVVAVIVVWLVKHFLPMLLVRIPSRLIMLWVSVVVAGFYALLVGFEIPAQRTFWMLVWVTLATQWLMTQHPYRILAWVALLMMWWDSTAVLQAGFWLSFVAVGLLLRFSEQQAAWASVSAQDNDSASHDSVNNSLISHWAKKIAIQLWQLFKLQLWLFMLMMPMVIWFFGKVSLASMLVNLIAVPLLGLVIVPLDMLAGIISMIPEVGSVLSQLIWSFLASILTVFHQCLEGLVVKGWAKQWFVALSSSELILTILIILITLARGVMPRIFILPVVVTLIALNVSLNKQQAEQASVTVLDNTLLSINLVVQGKTAWLILADNQDLTPVQKSSTFLSSKTGTLTREPAVSESLLDEVRQLLAHQGVTQLTGIISQTPSATTNQLVQRLAQEVVIKQYWLAGFDALQPLTDKQGQNLSYPSITPVVCQAGKRAGTSLKVEAVTGWALNLPKSTISDAQRLATQSCFIHITATDTHINTLPYSVLISAGQSMLPMQMSDKLCNTPKVDLLIQPFQTPFDKTWLSQTAAQTIHVITGKRDFEQLSEQSEFALLDSAQNSKMTLLKSGDTGVIEYRLTRAP